MPRITKRAPESIQGRYSPIPHAVLDSVAFQEASYPARALLFDLIRQHSGSNNGHLHLSMGWLGKRGWKSCDVVQRAKVELVDCGLIVETRKGGLSIGPSLFAVTWLNLTNYVGLDIRDGEFRRGGYAAKNKVSIPGNGTARTGTRNGAVPAGGVDARLPVPPSGAKTALFALPPVPPRGDNVTIAITPRDESGEDEPRPRRSLRDLVTSASAFSCE